MEKSLAPTPTTEKAEAYRIGSLITVYISTQKDAEDPVTEQEIANQLGLVFKSFSLFKGHGYWKDGAEVLYMAKIITTMQSEELNGVLKLIKDKLQQPTIGFEGAGHYYIIK